MRTHVSIAGLALVVACQRTDRRAADELDVQVAAAMRAEDPVARLSAVVAAANRPDDRRDREGRPPIPLGADPTPWRPFRIDFAIAAGPALVFNRAAADGREELWVARAGRPDRRLGAAPPSQFLVPLAVDDRFAYFREMLSRDGDRTSFRRVPLAGGRSEELGLDPDRATIAGDWLYWTHRDGHVGARVIHGLHRRTGATVDVDAPSEGRVTAMAATHDRLYVVVTDPPTRPLDLPPAHLLELALGPRGAPVADAVLTEVAVMTSDRPSDLAVEGDTLYYVTEGATLANDGTLRRWDRARRAGDALATGLALPTSLTAAAGHLCFGLMRPGDVREVDCLRLADGRLLVAHTSSTEVRWYSPVVFGGRVLWSQRTADGDETVGVPLDSTRP